MNTFDQFCGFYVEHTADGSPTLRVPDGGESMHHSAGAFSETVYLYSDVVDFVLSRPYPANLFNLGLGLGYSEMLWSFREKILLSQKSEMPLQSCFYSSELSEELIARFREWILQAPDLEKNSSIYDEMLTFFMNRYQPAFDLADFGQHFKAALEQERLCFLGPLNQNFAASFAPYQEVRFHGVLYDAFSKKTSAPLWEEGFLDEFISTKLAAECAFGSYACNAPLKKALRNHGFQTSKNPGFHGKRNSTFAIRGTQGSIR